jgi:hypothetical protein
VIAITGIASATPHADLSGDFRIAEPCAEKTANAA